MTNSSGIKCSLIPFVWRSLTRLLQASAFALVCSLIPVTPAWAVGSVLSGMFDGSEPAIEPLVGSECTQTPMGYRQSDFEVSAGGTYHFKNAFGHSIFNSPDRYGVGVTVSVYQGSFDVSDPGQNLVASSGADAGADQVVLAAGTSYVLVVQQWCWPDEGAWAVAFTGPGNVSSGQAVAVPPFTSGVIAGNAPVTVNHCASWWDTIIYSRYHQAGPVRVSRDGLYYFSDASNDNLCLSVYTAPDAPFANYVTSTYWDPIFLHAGQDYYFLTQISDAPDSGEYFYLLAPAAPFRINRGLADSWYNPETPGQGFFLDVFEQLNQVFLGWFTYTDDPNADDAFAHRWLTASGAFDGTTANLAIDWTAGGAFDSAQPPPEHVQDGTIELEFFDCRTGQVRYAWGGEDSAHPAVSGVILIERVVNDSVTLCESMYRGPGIPGPL